MIERVVKIETGIQRVYAVILGVAVVSFWRGIWNLSDLYLFSQNPTYSAVLSIFFGLLVILFLERLMRRLI